MKRMMLALCLLCVVGCDTPVSTSHDDAKTALSNIGYGFDWDTKLCYAFLKSAGYYGYVTTSITSVPCTEAVMAKVNK